MLHRYLSLDKFVKYASTTKIERVVLPCYRTRCIGKMMEIWSKVKKNLFFARGIKHSA